MDGRFEWIMVERCPKNVEAEIILMMPTSCQQHRKRCSQNLADIRTSKEVCTAGGWGNQAGKGQQDMQSCKQRGSYVQILVKGSEVGQRVAAV